MEGLAAALTFQDMAQDVPEWINEQVFKWVANNGLAVVFVILLLGLVVTPMFAIFRLITGGLGAQVSGAITLFAGTLSSMSTRQEQSSDMLATAIKDNMAATQELAKLVASMNESIRIQLNFTTQQMAQQAALTQQVQHVAQKVENGGAVEPSVTGIVKPVEESK